MFFFKRASKPDSIEWRGSRGRGEPLKHEDLTILWDACQSDPNHITERDARYKTSGGSYLRVNLFRAMGRLSAAIRPIRTRFPPLTPSVCPMPSCSWIEPTLRSHSRHRHHRFGKVHHPRRRP